ncbi:hypothetical protein F2Q70_00021918 [Brassica cretica]|uniref:Uncharacterized protein n=1 Tax=Brassica cretica TaxID=69181 RepID=A0A8S9GSI3_BRACR|nr:hypothetical protein F2Q70_00021918 [Brassica cretica]
MNSGWRTEWIEGSHEGFVRPPIFPTPNGSSELVVSKAERISTRAGRSVRDAGRSDQTSCLPAWPKSSESLRILALDKYPKEKSIIGSNKEARSSAQSPVHAVRAKRAKREKSRSESELARPKTISKGRRTFCKAAGRSDLTSCVPAWPKSSESLRILALEKYPKEKSMIGSNKEARSSAQSLVHALVELVGKDELQFGQFDHLVMDLAEAPIRTFAGRSGTRPDQSVWYGRKSEPRLGRLERPDLQTGLIPWTGAHPKGK